MTIDIDLLLANDTGLTGVLEEAKRKLGILMSDPRIEKVTYVSVDAETFVDGKEPDDYDRAPDYAMLKIGDTVWESHTVVGAQALTEKVNLPLLEYAIRHSRVANARATYSNTIRSSIVPAEYASNYTPRVSRINNIFILPGGGSPVEAPTLAAPTHHFG